MDWFDLKDNSQVIQIKESSYQGIKCTWVENQGWKITLGASEYLFPHYQAAQAAIDGIREDCVKKYGGVKLKAKDTQK